MITYTLFCTADRVILPRLSPSDLNSFQAYRSDPEVGKYQSWSPVPIERAVALLEEMSIAEAFFPGEWIQLGIAETLSNELIGDIGVFVAKDGEHAEIGFTLASGSQGQGLATESLLELIDLLFASTTIQRIVAITDSRNLACIRLLDRIGMKRVQTVDAIFRDGPCKEHWYERLRG